MHFETIDFSENLHNITDNKQFYGGLSYDEESIKEVLQRPVHSHTAELGSIIETDMSQYGLSKAQQHNIELLKKGHKVVIAGQQGISMDNEKYCTFIELAAAGSNQLRRMYRKTGT